MITLHVLIDVCSPPNFVVVNLNYETCIHSSLFNYFGFRVNFAVLCLLSIKEADPYT